MSPLTANHSNAFVDRRDYATTGLPLCANGDNSPTATAS